MNFFSVLGDSDDEEIAKKSNIAKKDKQLKNQEATSKGANANNPSKSAPVKGQKVVESSSKSKGSVEVTKATLADAVETEQGKENNRGGKPRGKGDHATTKERETKAENHGRKPKHEFDRRSGTGRGREQSRGGRGPFGAGNPAQDALEAEKNPTVAEVDSTAVVDIEGTGENGEATESSVEPEVPTKTFDDFMAEKEAARARLVDLVGVAKPVRAVDTSNAKFAGLVAKEADELGDFIPSVKGNSANLSKKDQRSTGKMQVDGVSFKFEAPSQRERDVRPGEERRGGRGNADKGRVGGRREGGRGAGGRGRGGSGRGGSGRGATSDVKTVLNSVDFPSLA